MIRCSLLLSICFLKLKVTEAQRQKAGLTTSILILERKLKEKRHQRGSIDSCSHTIIQVCSVGKLVSSDWAFARVSGLRSSARLTKPKQV